MSRVVFVTGNQDKADYLAKYLGIPIDHIGIDAEEIQSLDLQEIVDKKLEYAYQQVKRPVIVEDVALEFHAFGKFPGPFIKFMLQGSSYETVCRSLDTLSREATARCVYGYYDGTIKQFFAGSLNGSIAEHPSAGSQGFGWDKIFIPTGHTTARAELDDESYEQTYLQVKPIRQVRDFLLSNQLG